MAGVRGTERRLICVETSHGCLKGTEVGEGFFCKQNIILKAVTFGGVQPGQRTGIDCF